MITELGAPKFQDRWVRIHDSGDFFSDEYTLAWLRVMLARPTVLFYAYTKEVTRFRRLVVPDPPANFSWVFSLGGIHDALLDPATDRVADVFPTEQAITAAGWHSQQASDLLAVLGPAPVGMAANRIPALLNRLDGRRFSGWQAEIDVTRADRGRRPRRPTRASRTPPHRKEIDVTAEEPADQTPSCVTDGTIQLGVFPQNPSTAQADAVMRVVSEHFGQTWYAVKLSGWWRILCPEAGVGWGADAGQRTRDFSRALAQATGLPVERTAPAHPQG